MAKRKCFCGRDGEVTSLNGLGMVLCYDHAEKWRLHNGWALPRRIVFHQEKFQEGIEEIGQDWYEEAVRQYEDGEEENV